MHFARSHFVLVLLLFLTFSLCITLHADSKTNNPRSLSPITKAQINRLWDITPPEGLADAWSVSPESCHVTGSAKILEKQSHLLSIIYDGTQAKAMRLVFPKPVNIPTNTWRLRSLIYGLHSQMQVRFCLIDAKGKELIVKSMRSRPTSLTETLEEEWSGWDQLYSLNLHQPTTQKIQQRVLPEFRKQATDAMWTLPLCLVAIEVQASKPIATPCQLIFLPISALCQNGLNTKESWLIFDRFRVGYDSPMLLYPDDFTYKQGIFTITAQVTDGYQGPIIWEHQTTIHNNSKRDPVALLRDAIRVPFLPAGRYFLTLKAWQDQELVDERRWTLHSIRSNQKQMPTTSSNSWQWQTRHPHHVYPIGTKQATLHLTGQPQNFSDEFEIPQVHIVITDWKKQIVYEVTQLWQKNLRVTFPVKATDYNATAKLLTNGQVLDCVRLHFGVASDNQAEAGFVPPLAIYDASAPSTEAYATAEYNRPWYSNRHVRWPQTPWVNAKDVSRYDKWLNEHVLKRRLTDVSNMVCWSDLEVLPGVLRWDELDRRNNLAADAGIHIMAWIGVLGNWPPFQPDWWGGDIRLNQYGHPDGIGLGKINNRNPEASYWYATEEAYLSWLDKSVRHLRNNPAITQYKLMISSFSEKTRNPDAEHRTSDYAPIFQDQFNQWLISQGRPAKPLPKPLASPGLSLDRFGPDLSKAWIDFVQFKIHTANIRLEKSIAVVRNLDTQRPICIYRGPRNGAPEMAVPMLAKNKAYFFDESGPNYFSNALASMCIQGGVRYTNENHFYMPSSLEIIDGDIFYASVYNQGWNYSYRWHERHKRDELRYYESLDAISQLMPMVKNYHHARADEPQVLVMGSRLDAMLNGEKEHFFAAISGIDLYAGLFAYFQTPAHFANEFTPWVDYNKFKVVFVCGDVMTDAAIQRVIKHAKNKGKIVLVGGAGRYCVENPLTRDLLISAIGKLPNVRWMPKLSSPPPSPGQAPQALFSANRNTMLDLLQWAKVKQPIHAVNQDGQMDTAFECMLRRVDDKTIYASVHRRFVQPDGKGRWYDQIMHVEKNRKRWGKKTTQIKLTELIPGPYTITKIHRDSKPLGIFTVNANGILNWSTDQAITGQLQIYQVIRK